MPRRPRVESDDPELVAVLERLAETTTNVPSLAEQLALVAHARQRSAAAGPAIDQWLLGEVGELRRTVRDVQARQNELRKLHERLTAPPWFTGVFLRLLGGSPPRAAVTYQNTPRIVSLGEDVNETTLAAGDDVLLSHDLNLLLDKLTPSVKRVSEVGEFQHHIGSDRVVLKARDADVVVHAAGSLDVRSLRHGDRVLWDPSLAMAFERLPRPAESGLFLTETPTQRFADIGGLDPQIAQLRRAVGLHLQHPELVARYGLARASSVLLVGPPGTGKTMVARALAQWLGETSRGGHSRFLYIKPGSLHSMWWGQSEANYREVFRVAREVGAANPEMPVVMFFDEVDSIGTTRSSDTAQHVAGRVLESFMTELDGLQSRGNILVVAATNRRDALDPALLRPGRLGDLVLEVPRPAMAAGRAILERYFPVAAPYRSAGEGGRGDLIDVAISRLYAPNGLGEVAALTFRDGTRRAIHARDLVSGAMLAGIARTAVERACVRELETGEAGIAEHDVLDAIGDAVSTAVAALTPANCHTHLDDLPQDLAVARLDTLLRRQRRPQRFRVVA